MPTHDRERKLRSRAWWDNPANPEMTALYLERFLNYGLTREELQSDRPIIGIAQTGNDLVPCTRHLVELAERIEGGVRDAGGIPFEFPGPSAAGDRQATDRSLHDSLDREAQRAPKFGVCAACPAAYLHG